jgi:hypothetical protein
MIFDIGAAILQKRTIGATGREKDYRLVAAKGDK